MRSTLSFALSMLALCGSGCGGNVVIVKPGTVVRAVDPFGVRIATYDNASKTWREQQGVATFPAGTFIVPTTQP